MLRVAVVLTGLLLACSGIDEWNPQPRGPDAIAGTWSTDGDRLELGADGGFRYTPESGYIHDLGPSAGTWRLDDWNLGLLAESASGSNAGKLAQMRVVVAGGEYRIIRDPADPDSWDGGLGFRRTPKALAPPCPSC